MLKIRLTIKTNMEACRQRRQTLAASTKKHCKVGAVQCLVESLLVGVAVRAGEDIGSVPRDRGGGARAVGAARVVARNVAQRFRLCVEDERNDETVETQDLGEDKNQNHPDEQLRKEHRPASAGMLTRLAGLRMGPPHAAQPGRAPVAMLRCRSAH